MEQQHRRAGRKLAWLAAVAVIALVTGAGAAFATADAGATVGWPPAKAQAWQREQAEIAAARAHPRPKPASPQNAAPPHQPDPTPAAGIDNAMHQGPFPAMTFLVRNFWQGPVGPDWLLAYAGATRVPADGSVQQGGLRLYREARDANGDLELQEIGAFPAPGAVGAVTITAAGGDVLQLRTDSGGVLSFDLRTRQYR